MKLIAFIIALIAFVLAAFDVTAIHNVVDWGFFFLALGFIVESDFSFIKLNRPA